MSTLEEKSQWEEAIYEIRTIDPVLGGADGISNLATGQLANRTQWLKERVEESKNHLELQSGKTEAHEGRICDSESRIERQETLLNSHKQADHPYPQYQGVYRATAEGTADAITADFSVTLPEPPADQTLLFVRAQYANMTATPDFSTIGTQTRAIIKGNNQPLKKGDISGRGFEMMLQYSAFFDKWVLLNPAWGEYAEATTPVGSMMYWPLPSPPFGWLERNGATLSRVSFEELFSVIGTTYGAGDGSSTFSLPDDRGIFERGWDHGIGVDPGRGFASVQGDAIRNIAGYVAFDCAAGFMNSNMTGPFFAAGTTNPGYLDRRNDGHTRLLHMYFDASRMVPTAPENRPRNRAYLPIIKYR